RISENETCLVDSDSDWRVGPNAAVHAEVTACRCCLPKIRWRRRRSLCHVGGPTAEVLFESLGVRCLKKLDVAARSVIRGQDEPTARFAEFAFAKNVIDRAP